MTAANGPSTVAAVVVAGGSGRRLGAAQPKAFVEVGDGTLLGYTIDCFLMHQRVGALVVVAPQTHLDEARRIVRTSAQRIAVEEARLDAHGIGTPQLPTTTAVVPGGVTRQASVAAGLAALAPEIEFVLVHDAARPFVTRRVISAVLAALRAGADAVVPVVPVHDTLRRVDVSGALAGVVDRDELVAVQTPQGFRRTALVEAHAAGARLEVTDDAALVEALGGSVAAVPGADELFKITREWDLAVAQAIIETGGFLG